MSTDAKMYVCATCAKKGNFMRCGGCKVVRYCDKTCQRLDWPSHKKQCAPNKLPEMSQRMEDALRSGVAHLLASSVPESLDSVMYEQGVKSGAYTETQVDLGHGVVFGISHSGWWLRLKKKAAPIELGKLVGMDAIAGGVDAVMKEHGLPIKGKDAYLQLMQAVVRVFAASQ